MADTTGSAALLGAGSPGDPNTGAGQTGNPAPQPKPASGGSWLDGIEDPDIKGWATKKNGSLPPTPFCRTASWKNDSPGKR